MKIYELLHMHRAEILSDGRFHYGDTARLGYFSSLDQAVISIEKYREISGFRDYPNGFAIFEHEIENVASVYLAEFYAHDPEFEFEYSSSLGIFTKEREAYLAVEIFRQNNHMNWEDDELIVELNVDKYRIDEMSCIYGFDF